MPLPTVTTADTAAWLNDMTAEGLSGKTQRNRHGLLYGAFDSAVRDGLIPDNPCRRQRIATTHRDDSEKVFLTPEESMRMRSEPPVLKDSGNNAPVPVINDESSTFPPDPLTASAATDAFAESLDLAETAA